jgi:hypothetical protein
MKLILLQIAQQARLLVAAGLYPPCCRRVGEEKTGTGATNQANAFSKNAILILR